MRGIELLTGQTIRVTPFPAARRVGRMARREPIVPGRADPAAFLALIRYELRRLIAHGLISPSQLLAPCRLKRAQTPLFPRARQGESEVSQSESGTCTQSRPSWPAPAPSLDDSLCRAVALLVDPDVRNVDVMRRDKRTDLLAIAGQGRLQ